MRSTISYILVCLLLSAPGAHASEWLRNASRERIQLGKVTAIAAMGDGGHCAVTADGNASTSRDGSSWATARSTGAGNLRCVDFLDAMRGVAGGDNTGAGHNLIYTTDGGATWKAADCPFDVRAVCAVSPITAVLAGDGGIAAYRFGDREARTRLSVAGAAFTGVDFHGGTGMVCASDGSMYRSPDGGETWERLAYAENGTTLNWPAATDPTGSHRDVALYTIVMKDNRTAYAAGAGGVLLKTTDGGDSWSRRETGTTEGLTSMTLKPDGGISLNAGGSALIISDKTDLYSVRYFHDRLGRLVASQNSRQRAMRPQRYSYTLYDALGRNIEAGELESDKEPDGSILNGADFPGNWSDRRHQVVRTIYDEALFGEEGTDSHRPDVFPTGQRNLRNRVSATLYREEYDADPSVHTHATYYSYDIHGNVERLVHDLPELGQERYKRISYDCDLVSGRVNRLDYQKGKPDGYSLRYGYDAENRLTSVHANYGDEGENWHELAGYEYYRHGPLARTVLGKGLQSVDHAYTLQGWTKGVNMDADASDVFGYELQYNDGDYKPIGGGNRRAVDAGAANLHNGNIAAMRTTLATPNAADASNQFGAQTRRFSYDELNRLVGSQVAEGDRYATAYSYDANGNILSLNRNDQNGNGMDRLTYRYATDANGNITSNRLLHVNDNAANGAGGADVKDQGAYAQTSPATRNYAYDEVGNLISDRSEEIAEIRWNASGKVTDVIRSANSSKPDLRFAYDATGNRVSKTVINKNAAGGDKYVTTYYVRDPQGNALAVYEHKHGDSDNGTFTLAEQHLYGTGRLGMRKRDLALNVANASESTPVTHYELTNHLGNVMAVISDKASDTNEPTVVSLSDYYPFGMTEPGRSYTRPGDDYRFGYTGHEKENDLAEGVYTTEYRLLDTRLGRWLSVDPLAGKNVIESPYEYCSGNPIIFWDSDGRIKCKEDGTLDITYEADVVNPLLEQRRQQYDAIDPGNPMNPYSGSNGYKYGVAYTDKGTPFIVMTYIGEGGKHDRAVNNTNCFGACFLGGQAFIPCGIDAQVILAEEYHITPKTERSTSTPEVMNYQAGDVLTAMNGDIVIYTNSRWGTIPQHASEIVEIVPPYEISEYKMSVNLFSKDGRFEPRDITLNMQIIIDGINPITSEPFQIYNQLWSYEGYEKAQTDNKTVYRRISGKNVPKDVIKKEVTEDNIINEDY